MVKKFSTSIQGYNKQEVNEFVHEVINEYESMLNRLKASTSEVNKLQSELKHYKDIEEIISRKLIVADESANNIKRTAYNESKVIIEDAKRNASKLINDALLKAELIESDAETLKRKVSFYKKRFKMLVEEHLNEIEAFEDFKE